MPETKQYGIIYADPPYVKTERLYWVAGKLGRFRRFHVRLWQVLTGRDSYVVLSYNDCPFIRKLYQDWYILSFQRSNPLSQKKGSSFGELIITNYDPRKACWQLSLESLLNCGSEARYEPIHEPERPIKTTN